MDNTLQQHPTVKRVISNGETVIPAFLTVSSVSARVSAVSRLLLVVGGYWVLLAGVHGVYLGGWSGT